MSQTKAQLVAPIGVVTASGVVASGVVTASSFDAGSVTGTATSIIQGENLNVGIMSASGFSGDFTGSATGITTGSDIKVGAFTASSFTGDFTGTATSMMRGTGFKAGAVNATGFVADVIGNVTGNVTGNVSVAGSVASGANIEVGVMTATSYYGDGSNLTGIAATNFNTQTVTANSAETIIDLADGNCITMNQSADTTVGFASTSTAMDITIIRKNGSGTLSWPSNVKWNGGSAPDIVNNTDAEDDFQQFQFITRDSGLTWYAWENAQYDPDLTMWIWGRNNVHGDLGQNNLVQYSSPVQMSGTTWNDAAGSQFDYGGVAGQKSDGTIWCWGDNYHGCLGLNDQQDKSSPTQLGADTTWNNVTISYSIAQGVKTDGTMWTWGDTEAGELGLNGPLPVRRSSPMQVGTDTTWTKGHGKSMAIYGYMLAIKNDGTMWGWGSGRKGQRGSNDQIARSSPTQVGTETTFAYLDGSYNRTAITKTDGTLWIWGDGPNGVLGQNQTGTIELSSPTQVGTDTTWAIGRDKMHIHGSAVGAIKTDGTLWMWGTNNGGCLGQNQAPGTIGSYSSPIQVGTDTTWRTVRPFRGNSATMATKTDGTLWTWGLNGSGGAGHNDTTARSSPTQVPGTWSSKVCGYNDGAIAFKVG